MELEKNSTTTTTGVRASSAATVYAKRFMSVLRSVAKAKSILTAIKSKCEAMKCRLSVFSLMRNAKSPSPLVTLCHKIHSSLLPAHGHLQEKTTAGQQQQDTSSSTSRGDLHCSRGGCCYHDRHNVGTVVVHEDQSMVVFDDPPEEEDQEEKDELEQLVLKQGEDPNAYVIDLVRNSKEEVGENFSLEAEIDHVADLFIMKFHKTMRMQKLESFKRYQQMLERSAA